MTIMNYISPRFEVKNASQNDTTDLYIYGTIGGGFWFGGVTSKDVRRMLSDVKTSIVNVHIHSNGGDAFEGVAICNLLKNHKATINVYIDGMAASAASVIAMAGDKIIMPKNTMMMVHRASVLAYGNAASLRKTADTLVKVDEALIQSYTDRFNGDQMELEKLLDEETFLTATEAMAYGFCDEIAEAIKQADEGSVDGGGASEGSTPPAEPVDPGIEQNQFNRFAAMTNAFHAATQKFKGKE